MTEGMDRNLQVLAFVLDSLQVVSYKWLSRKFSISSNESKRLLQSVAEQHSGNIDIIYAVSGWAKADHSCYSVKLVPKSKLQEAKDMLDGHISTHVYSIQPCIPKDPAELWSAEYVQSEELFKEPSEHNNCLRDNRFSAVSCSSVTRQVRGMSFSGNNRPVTPKVAAPSSSLSKVEAPSSSPPKLSVVQADVLKAQPPPSGPSKESVQGTSVADIGTVSKASGAQVGPAAKGASGTKQKNTGSGDGALANLWGRASSKPKPAVPEAQLAAAASTGAVETLERAHDHPIDWSSDDEDASNFARIRRGDVKSSSKRTRRMIVDDMSDEDNADENIVSLSSPELPKEKPGNRILSEKNEKQIDAPVQHLKEAKVDSFDIVLDKKKKPDKKVPKAEETNKSTKVVKIGATPKAEETNKSTKVVNIGAATSAPEAKKRKVIKTRIDERGREVTEVVWETENQMTSDGNKEENGINGADGQQHAQMGLSSAPSVRPLGSASAKAPMQNPTNKAGGNKSSGKGGSKDANQGRISSFFKKAS